MTHLIVFTFSISAKSPFLSHQQRLVLQLAEDFNKTTVITRDTDVDFAGFSYRPIETLSWRSNSRIRSLLRLLSYSLVLLVKRERKVVLFHMTDSVAAAISPFCRLLGVPTVLWYAHTHPSIYLKFCTLFINQFVTSTQGSFPHTFRSCNAIGQAIDLELFQAPPPRGKESLYKLFHVGRLDKSKKIDTLIETLTILHSENYKYSLTLIGTPTSKPECDQFRNILETLDLETKNHVFTLGNLSTESLIPLIKQLGIFVHAFYGSLDKSVLEATAMRRPVVSLNPEYLKIFKPWSSDSYALSGSNFLVNEIKYILSLEHLHLLEELEKRRKVISDHHSIQRWRTQMTSILYSVMG